MDIEFHYWVTGIIAHAAGFTEEEARIIAYSSQYADDNDVTYEIGQRGSKKKKYYYNFVSQTMDIFQPKADLMRIYPIFHFVPGKPSHPLARRRDGKMHLLTTTPNNKNTVAQLDAAFKSPEDLRLYRIGIAIHAYADSWAHQNFVGWSETFNALSLKAIPLIGHMDAFSHPDWLGHRWQDPRLIDADVNNNRRFLSAAERMFRKCRDFMVSQKRFSRKQLPKWPDLMTELVSAFGPDSSGAVNQGKDARMEKYRQLAPWLPEYNEKTWFDEAIETNVRVIPDRHQGLRSKFTLFKDAYYWRKDKDIPSTDWFRFQKAVKEHERFSLRLLASVFDQLGIPLAKA